MLLPDQRVKGEGESHFGEEQSLEKDLRRCNHHTAPRSSCRGGNQHVFAYSAQQRVLRWRGKYGAASPDFPGPERTTTEGHGGN